MRRKDMRVGWRAMTHKGEGSCHASLSGGCSQKRNVVIAVWLYICRTHTHDPAFPAGKASNGACHAM